MSELEISGIITVEDFNINADKIIDDIVNYNKGKVILNNDECKTIIISLQEYINLLKTSQENNYIKKQTINYKNKYDGKVKIGILVKSTLNSIETNSKYKFNDIILEKLCTAEYSKESFGLNYSFLKKYNDYEPINEQIMVGTEKKYNRYWKKIYTFNNTKYLVCSHWHNRHEEKFVKWMNEHVHINPYDQIELK